MCLSCLGCSLGSCLLVKAESFTQCVLCRMCGLKAGTAPKETNLARGFPGHLNVETAFSFCCRVMINYLYISVLGLKHKSLQPR